MWEIAALLLQRAKLQMAFNLLAAAHPDKTAEEVEADAQRRIGSSLRFTFRKYDSLVCGSTPCTFFHPQQTMADPAIHNQTSQAHTCTDGESLWRLQ